MYKILNNLLPSYFLNLFTTNLSILDHFTRQAFKLHITPHLDWTGRLTEWSVLWQMKISRQKCLISRTWTSTCSCLFDSWQQVDGNRDVVQRHEILEVWMLKNRVKLTFTKPNNVVNFVSSRSSHNLRRSKLWSSVPGT